MNKLERRSLTGSVETRTDEKVRTLVGYAAVFNSPTDIGGLWSEEVAPGAFSEAVNGDVRALVDHNTGRVIGRTKSGTLRLSEDSKGLRCEIDLPDTTDGNDIWALVERGDISGMSFGFQVTKNEWDETGDMPKRTIQKVELYEVSAVAFPAYDDTEIGKRALQEFRAHSSTPTIPAAAPVARAAIRTRLKMDLDFKVRTKR
jgi:uncharacterized protein